MVTTFALRFATVSVVIVIVLSSRMRRRRGRGRRGSGVDVMRSFHWVRFANLEPGPGERDFSFPAAPPAAVAIPGSNLEVVLKIEANPHDTLRTSVIDWGRIAGNAGELAIRNWRPGDRLVPVGHSQEQKVKSLFNEWRVPLWDRRNWPILCLGDKVVWTRQFGAAAQFAPDSTTRTFLQISERIRI